VFIVAGSDLGKLNENRDLALPERVFAPLLATFGPIFEGNPADGHHYYGGVGLRVVAVLSSKAP
jgi:hypothetical protein